MFTITVSDLNTLHGYICEHLNQENYFLYTNIVNDMFTVFVINDCILTSLLPRE